MCTEEVDPKDGVQWPSAASNLVPSLAQDVYAAIHKGGLWLGPRFQAGCLRISYQQLRALFL